MNLKISQLTAVDTLSTSDVIPVVNLGTTKKTSVSQINQFPINYTHENFLPLSGGIINGSLSILSSLEVNSNSLSNYTLLIEDGKVLLGGDLTVTGLISTTSGTSSSWNQTLSFNETTKDLSISSGNSVSLSALLDDTGIDSGVRSLSSNWQSTYTTVLNNSASWINALSAETSEVMLAKIYNAETVPLVKGNVVYTFGATGDVMSVKLASNASEATSSKTLGFVNETIASGGIGYVVIAGQIEKMSLPHQNFLEGDALWLGSTPGSFTNIKPVAPNHGVYLGVVERANNGDGLAYVKVQNGYELNEIHDVLISSISAGQILRRNTLNNLWVNSDDGFKWDSTYSTVQSNSATNWNNTIANQYAHSNFLPLSGGLVTGATRFNNNVTIFGDLSCSGTQTFANTVFTTTSAVSVVHFGSGPALWVGNNGNGDIASFYDTDQSVEVLHVGGNNGDFPNVGVKTSTPNKDFTVNGEISASGTIWAKDNNSDQWNSVYSTVYAKSATEWDNSLVQNYVTNSFLPLSGGTMTGKLTLSNPTSASIRLNIGLLSGSDPIDVMNGDVWIRNNNDFRYRSLGGTFILAAINNYNTFSVPQVFQMNNASTALRITQTGTGNAFVVEDSTNPDSTPFVVDANGSVGIGLSSLSGVDAKLTVVGNVSSTGIIYASGGNSDQWNSVYSTVLSNSSVNWNYQGTDLKELSANWQNTFSTVQANSATYIVAGGNSRGSNILIGSNDNFNLDLETNNTSRITILNTGNVGIGTTNPNQALTVSGNISAVGTHTFIQPISASGLSVLTITQAGSGNALTVSGRISSTEIQTNRFVSNDQLYYSTDNRTSLLSSLTGTVLTCHLSALSGNYDEGQFLGRVKLSQNNNRLTNVGVNWVPRDSNRNWLSVCMSSDGKYQTAVANGGQIYISSDYGNTWVPRESSRSWNSVCMSSDGKYQTAVANGGQIYISSDYGNTWVPRESSRSWRSVCMSSDGKYQTAANLGGQIYISSNYGNTWVARDSNRDWISVCMSSDGKYQTAAGGGVLSTQIYISSNYGNTWVPRDSSRFWQSVCMSSDGKYQTAVAYNDQIYISSDYGNTWVPRDSSRSWRSVCMSSDGKYQTAVVDGGQIYISSNYGNTWVPRESSRDWRSICMSSDGKYQTAVVNNGGQIYISVADEIIAGNLTTVGSISSTEIQTNRFVSNDQLYYSTDNRTSLLSSLTGTVLTCHLSALSGNYDEGQFLGRVKLSQNNNRLTNVGVNWVPRESNRNWRSVCMSSDGKYQTAVNFGGQIYISSDYGNTWVARDSNRFWISVCMSSDGKCQTAVVGSGQIYISSDYGNTWVPRDSSRNWFSVCMSSDGKYQTAVNFEGQIYISSDYGNTWVPRDSNRDWISVCMSSDGKYQTAVVDGGQIYISSDYGNNWVPRDSSRFWYSVYMSSDGKYQTAVVYSDQIYISSDYGNTWVPRDSNRDWFSVCMSSDGKYQTAVVNNGGQIYISVADEIIAGNLTTVGSISSTSVVYVSAVDCLDGVILKSPNNFKWKIYVTNTGSLSTISI